MPVKVLRLVALYAGFVERRHVRQQRRALRRRDRDRLDAALADMADRGGELVHHAFDLAAEQVGDRRAAALVGHMQHLDVGHAHEELDRQVVGRAASGGCDRRSALEASASFEFRVVRRGGLRRRGQHDRHRLDAADRDEVLQRVVVPGLPHRRAGGDGAARAEQQGVAVGADFATAALPIEPAAPARFSTITLLAERFTERGRDGARRDVDVAARRPGHDDADRLWRGTPAPRRRNRPAGPESSFIHSAFAPETFTTSAQRATSSRSSLENSSGVLPTGSAPCSMSFWLQVGRARRAHGGVVQGLHDVARQSRRGRAGRTRPAPRRRRRRLPSSSARRASGRSAWARAPRAPSAGRFARGRGSPGRWRS